MAGMDIIKIQEAIKKGNVNISEHADEELENDAIADGELYYSVLHGEVVEDYADDKPFPSCLIYGMDKNNKPIHSVWAYSDKHKIAVLVTTYIPDPEKWSNYKTRKPKR